MRYADDDSAMLMMRLGFQAGVVALALAAAGTMAAGGPHQRQKFIPAHHARGHKRAAYFSPDGRYVARVSFEDAEVKDEVAILTISRSGARGSRATFSGVNGFAWLPCRPHALVASTGGGHNGTGTMALWTAAKGARVLLHGGELEDDNFDIERVSADGRALIYEHFGYGVSGRHPEHGLGPHRLTVPSS